MSHHPFKLLTTGLIKSFALPWSVCAGVSFCGILGPEQKETNTFMSPASLTEAPFGHSENSLQNTVSLTNQRKATELPANQKRGHALNPPLIFTLTPKNVHP